MNCRDRSMPNSNQSEEVWTRRRSSCPRDRVRVLFRLPDFPSIRRHSTGTCGGHGVISVSPTNHNRTWLGPAEVEVDPEPRLLRSHQQHLNMPRGRSEPTRAQYSHGLEYVANKPAFLQNFGRPVPSSPDRDGERGGRGGREPLPERPDEGEWARGSDDEEEDEWDVRFGGGEDGPQVVVLKEGRHLSAAEVDRERKIGESPSFFSADKQPRASTRTQK